MEYKQYYNSLSFIQKVEIYGIVILCYIFIALVYNDIYFSQDNKTEKSIQIITKKIVQNKIKHFTNVELLSYIENKSIQFTLDILDMKFTKKTIILQITGSFINEIHFLEHIQENFVILKCELKKEKKEIMLDLIIDIRKYFDKEDVVLSNIPNPFLGQKKRKKRDNSIKIDAIISDEVLIEGDWYKKGAVIKGFIISHISDTEVLFIQKNTHKKMIRKITNE